MVSGFTLQITFICIFSVQLYKAVGETEHEVAASFDGQMELQGIPMACTRMYSDCLVAGYHSQSLEVDLARCNEKIARFRSRTLSLAP